MTSELREDLERARVQKLERQIGALQAALEEIGAPRNRFERMRHSALKNKIEKLRFNLRQPMLLAL